MIVAMSLEGVLLDAAGAIVRQGSAKGMAIRPETIRAGRLAGDVGLRRPCVDTLLDLLVEAVLFDEFDLYPGAREGLNALDRNGLRVWLTTVGPPWFADEIGRRLRRSDLAYERILSSVLRPLKAVEARLVVEPWLLPDERASRSRYPVFLTGPPWTVLRRGKTPKLAIGETWQWLAPALTGLGGSGSTQQR